MTTCQPQSLPTCRTEDNPDRTAPLRKLSNDPFLYHKACSRRNVPNTRISSDPSGVCNFLTELFIHLGDEIETWTERHSGLVLTVQHAQSIRCSCVLIFVPSSLTTCHPLGLFPSLLPRLLHRFRHKGSASPDRTRPHAPSTVPESDPSLPHLRDTCLDAARDENIVKGIRSNFILQRS